MRRVGSGLLVGGLLAVGVVAGCGSEPAVVAGTAPASPYDGPMSVPVDHSDEAGVLARSGAAGRALECTGAPYAGGGADYDSGLATVQDSPTEALRNLLAKDWIGEVPEQGYRVERRDDHRVLLSFDVDARTKVAFVVADDVADWKHHTGWGVEAWAACDPAELPASVTAGYRTEVWTDAAGTRVPVTEVVSWRGPEHCDWQDITFLEIGADPDRGGGEEYLRDTHGELARWTRGRYQAHATLPKDATATGWQRDGRALWRVPDRSAAYLVSVTDPADVERWPASTGPIGCD